MRYWVGVASHEHVRAAVAGGFCQFSHGKAAPLHRLTAGDRVVYYSPREGMRRGTSVQAFTAVGEVLAGAPEPVDQDEGFQPSRRRVRYFQASAAPIAPLLPKLSFTRERSSWGYAFRRGFFQIEGADYHLIEGAMNTYQEKTGSGER